jgi:gliding motility-associated-like protein
MKKLLLVLQFLVFVNYSSAQMVLSQSATSQSCDCYTLTTATNNIYGGIFSPNTIDLTLPFDFSFDVYLGVNDTWSADGIAFVLQQGQAAIDPNPESFGANTLVPSLGIEIDTHPNPNAPHNDPNSDHIDVFLNGDVTTPVSPVVNIPNIEDGGFHIFNVIWNPVTQILQINLDGNIINAYNADIINTVFAGNSNVFFGFTGATGGLNNLQQVCFHRDADFTQDKLTACAGETVTFTDNSSTDLIYSMDYLWDFGDGTTSTLENPTHTWATTGAKNVTLTITDVSGCTDVSNVNITITAGINVTVVPQDVSCNGLNDGVLNTALTNGTAPYTYVWDLASNVQNPNGLAPNTYNLTVTDNLGCTGSGQGIIMEPTALSFDNLVTTDALCGATNGTITATASSGTTNYAYSINGGFSQPSNIFNNLAAGNYTILVIDANGCTVDWDTIIAQPSLLVINSAVPTDVSCGGLPDGTITVTASNGIAPYTYSLDGGVAQNSNVFNNLTANTYSVEVFDANLCSVTENNIIVNSATAMTLDNIVTVDASCSGLIGDGSLEVFITGGDPVITYSNDGGTTFQNSAIFTGLVAANYAVQVMDGNGCVVNGNTVIGEPTPLSIDNIVVNSGTSCTDSLDGQITITSSGGNGVYTYTIDAGVTSTTNNVIDGLGAGNYTLTLMEGVNCSTTVNGDFLITEPALITIPNVAVTDVTCNGLSDGELVITATGGTAPYQYSNDGGLTFQNSNTFSVLGFGDYDIEVTDFNNCPVAGQTENISESAPLTVSLGTSDTTVCLGSSAGDVCATVSGGDGNYTYDWNGLVIPNNCLPIITTTAGSTTYSVVVTDGSGCVSNNNIAIDKIVTVLGPLALTATTVNPNLCLGDQASLFAEATLGSGNGGPYTFTWTNDQNGNVLIGANQIVSPIDPTTTYTVTISDGCTVPDVSTPVIVNVYNNPPMIITPNTSTNGCPPFEIEIGNAIDQSLIASQLWDFGNGNTSTDSSSTQLFEDEGCYDVSYSFVTNDLCVVDTVLAGLICVNPNPIADFSFSPDNPDLLNLEVQFTNESIGALAYLWDFGTDDFSSEVSPIYFFPEYGAEDWPVELKATNTFGCMDSITKTVHITELQIYYIPNSFTPDGSGVNDKFRPTFIPGFIPSDYSFIIFDRWGNQLFETNDIYSSWNAIYKGDIVKNGTYVWQISFLEKETDKRHLTMGHVTVLR